MGNDLSHLDRYFDLSYILHNLEMAEQKESRLLIVEDNLQVVNALVRFLQYLGYNNFDVAEPKEACNKITKSNYSILITDLNMPDINGYELISFTRKNSPNTVCMLVTADLAENLNPPEGITPDEVLLKPYTFTELKEAMQRAELKRIRLTSI